MSIVPIPCLKDNYAYLVRCDHSNEAAIVDASEGAPVLEALADAGVTLRAVWSTHHHHDHVGGNEEVRKRHPNVEIFGHTADRGRLPGQSRFLNDGDTFTLGTLSIRVLHIPGHTLGAIAYYVEEAGDAPAVFTGDTLFVAGCGRLFEGTPSMMTASLAKLAALPDAARVYCGHEYTENNLRFASQIEPSNRTIDDAQRRASEQRARGVPTVPSTIAIEKETNPFLRTSSNEIRQRLEISKTDDNAGAFAVIREAKDRFR